MSEFDFERAIPFIEAIPPGRWTSFKDVAAAAGNPNAFMSAGNHIRDSQGAVRNYWRVIHRDGTVPENFVAPADRGPKDPSSARQQLISEGVRFARNGSADPAQRFSFEDWVRMGRPSAPDRNAEADARNRTIVAHVNQRRIVKGRPPLTASQEADILSRLAAEREPSIGPIMQDRAGETSGPP